MRWDQAAIDGVVCVDADGCILQLNRAAERMLGWPEAEALGRRFGQLFVPPDELPRRTEAFKKLVEMEEGEATSEPVEMTLVRRDGSLVLVETTAARTTVDGRPALIAFFHDVAAQRALAELAYSAPRLPLSERLPIVTYTNLLWPVAATVWMSPQAERVTGYPAEEWTGASGFFASVLHPSDRDAVLEEARASRSELRAFSLDYRIVARDGRIVWVHDESVPIVDASGRLELVQGYFIDITERKQLEQQLLHSQKTEELGRLAGQIAHDFNNLLTAIRSYADLLAKRLVPGDRGARTRPGDRRDDGDGRPISPSSCSPSAGGSSSTRATSSSQASSGGSSRCSHALPETRWSSTSSSSRRRSSMPTSGSSSRCSSTSSPTHETRCRTAGRSTVATYATALEGGEPADRLGLAPGDYAVLLVSDAGQGMDAETKARVFEPFFTTKGRHGTGLGLAIVDSVIHQCGGAVDVESTPVGERASGSSFPPSAVDGGHVGVAVAGRRADLVQHRELVRCRARRRPPPRSPRGTSAASSPGSGRRRRRARAPTRARAAPASRPSPRATLPHALGEPPVVLDVLAAEARVRACGSRPRRARPAS